MPADMNDYFKKGNNQNRDKKDSKPEPPDFLKNIEKNSNFIYLLLIVIGFSFLQNHLLLLARGKEELK